MLNIIFIMLTAGAVGGVANFLRSLQSAKTLGEDSLSISPPNKLILFGSNLISAEIAAFLIPLFLSLASSNLIAEAQSDWKKQLIFGGFCLVAASLSDRFTNTISQRLLAQVEGTKQVANAADERSKKIEKKQKQVEGALTEPEVTRTKGLHAAIGEIDEHSQVMQTFENSSYVFRSLSGIAHDLDKTPENAKPILEELVHHGELAVSQTEGGLRWYKINRINEKVG